MSWRPRDRFAPAWQETRRRARRRGSYRGARASRSPCPLAAAKTAGGRVCEFISGPAPCFETAAARPPQHEAYCIVSVGKPHPEEARRAVSKDGGFRSTEPGRSEEHTSELQSLMRISYAVFCLKKKNQ